MPHAPQTPPTGGEVDPVTAALGGRSVEHYARLMALPLAAAAPHQPVPRAPDRHDVGDGPGHALDLGPVRPVRGRSRRLADLVTASSRPTTTAPAPAAAAPSSWLSSPPRPAAGAQAGVVAAVRRAVARLIEAST
jgi:hypothetical protein